MRPGLPGGGGVSTSPSEVKRDSLGWGQLRLLQWRSENCKAKWSPPQDNQSPCTQWHGWSGCLYNQLSELDMWNWRILNITACDLAVPSVPTVGEKVTQSSLDAIVRADIGCHFKAMFNEVRKYICGGVLCGTCTQAQKCTMDTFCDLDMNWKSQGNAIEIKIRLESLSWARNRCTFCYLKKKFFCPLLSSPHKLCPATILRWPFHRVFLRCF